VEAGDQRFLVDPSWGLRERLMQIGSFELLTGIDQVLITHLHFDHTIGFTDLWLTGWLYGRRVPLNVRGPMITIGDEIEISDRPIVEGASFEKSKVLK